MRHVRKGYANALRVDDGTGLVISRPDLQPDLTPVVERGVVPVSYLNSYVADDEQPCAFCAKRTPHKRGYTVSLADGRIALCGHCCADRFFGREKAAALSSDYLQRHRLAMLRQAVANLQAGIAVVLSLVGEDIVRFEHRALQALHLVHRSTRNLSLRRSPIAGIDVLLAGEAGTPARVSQARERISSWARIDPTSAPPKQLLAVMRELANVDGQMRTGLRILSDAATLFRPENFQHVTDFCRHQRRPIDLFSLSRDPDGQLMLHRQPRAASWPSRTPEPPSAHRIGSLPRIPEWLGLTTYGTGVSEFLQEADWMKTGARKTKARRRK